MYAVASSVGRDRVVAVGGSDRTISIIDPRKWSARSKWTGALACVGHRARPVHSLAHAPIIMSSINPSSHLLTRLSMLLRWHGWPRRAHDVTCEGKPPHWMEGCCIARSAEAYASEARIVLTTPLMSRFHHRSPLLSYACSSVAIRTFTHRRGAQVRRDCHRLFAAGGRHRVRRGYGL